MLQYAKNNLSITWHYKYEFLPYRSAYLLKENTEDDVNPNKEAYRDTQLEFEYGDSVKSLNNIYN